MHIFIFVFGILGNLITFVVYCRKRFKVTVFRGICDRGLDHSFTISRSYHWWDIREMDGGSHFLLVLIYWVRFLRHYSDFSSLFGHIYYRSLLVSQLSGQIRVEKENFFQLVLLLSTIVLSTRTYRQPGMKQILQIQTLHPDVIRIRTRHSVFSTWLTARLGPFFSWLCSPRWQLKAFLNHESDRKALLRRETSNSL